MLNARTTLLFALLLITPVITGCIGAGDELQEQSVAPEQLLQDLLQFRQDGGFTLDQPVQVVLVGFEPGVGDELQAALDPEEVLHAAMTFTRGFPPAREADVPDPEDLIAPATARALYDVHQVDPAFAQDFWTHVQDLELEDGVYDANAAEDRLAETLPQAGVTVDRDLPVLVVLHAGDHLQDHAWRFTYENGDLEPVRAFGERHPMLVYDVSAKTDPYVVGGGTSPFALVLGEPKVEAYNHQLSAGGSQTVEALETLVLDASHYRLLKGPIYPISTKACHKVTLVLAVHQSAVSSLAPGARAPEEWANPDRLASAFENATDDEVIVEFKTLMLPVDDPVLDATSRRAAGLAESMLFLDMMRWYLSENWETYVDSEPGCEDYLSLLLHADQTSDLGRGFSGIGMYDVTTDRRITFSVVTDAYRLTNEHDGPLDDQMGYDHDRRPDYVNRLFSHETGHVLGLHHPQHLTRADGAGSPVNHAFESVWSSMSYQVSDRTVDFGDIDRTQWVRNRAGYSLQQAQVLDLQDTAAYQQALEALAQYDWVGVHEALEGPLNEALEANPDAVSYHTYGTLPVPR